MVKSSAAPDRAPWRGILGAMSEGPTTAQGLTQIALGGATLLVVLGVPIALFVRATEAGASVGGR